MEYIFVVEGVKKAIWLRGVTGDLGFTQACMKIYCDSQREIYMTNN